MIKSFHIQNYRNLKSVSVNELTRVNLLVGLNNVGKTSFLEAVNLYTSKNPSRIIDNILERRGMSFRRINRDDKLDIVFDILTSFFYKKTPYIYENEGIVLYDSEKEKLTIALEKISAFDKKNSNQLSLNQLAFDDEMDRIRDFSKYGLSFRHGEKSNFYPLKEYPILNNVSNLNFETQSIFVSSNNTSYRELGRYWDKNIYLTDKEFDVINALKIIEPNIEKIGFKGDITRSVEIKLIGDNQLYNLNDMGDGMNRILSIIISMIFAENGTLLIDEFENGLHYTAQYQLWEMIFTLALKLNVQVFVSTHSSDCIKSFENILNNGFSNNGKVLRLENKKGNIMVQEFDSKEMEIVAQNDVEIR